MQAVARDRRAAQLEPRRDRRRRDDRERPPAPMRPTRRDRRRRRARRGRSRRGDADIRRRHGRIDEPASPTSRPKRSRTSVAEDAASRSPKSRRRSRRGGRSKRRRPPDEPIRKMDWYILKVQSNREDSIARGACSDASTIAGLDDYFGEIIVPTEMVSEFKGGKKQVVEAEAVSRATSSCTWRSTTTRGSWSARRPASAISPAPAASRRRCCRTKSPQIVAKQEEKTDEAPKLEDQASSRATA